MRTRRDYNLEASKADKADTNLCALRVSSVPPRKGNLVLRELILATKIVILKEDYSEIVLFFLL
jgi:hypothetical protein